MILEAFFIVVISSKSLIMRALENGRYVLRATNTGVTAIIDSNGEIQSILTLFQQGVLTGNIQPMKGSTFFSRYGDYPLLGFVFVLMLGMGWYARR